MGKDESRNIVEFNVKIKMNRRWVSRFLGMLKYMEFLSKDNSSREVTFFAEGDKDFYAVFEWDKGLPSPANPTYDKAGNRVY